MPTNIKMMLQRDIHFAHILTKVWIVYLHALSNFTIQHVLLCFVCVFDQESLRILRTLAHNDVSHHQHKQRTCFDSDDSHVIYHGCE